MLRTRVRIVILSLALGSAAACDGWCGSPAGPTADANGIVLTLTAEPTTITTLSTSQSNITAIATAQGSPLVAGTSVQFSTNLGLLLLENTLIGVGGRATTTLRSDGHAGIATVTVKVGAKTSTVTVQINTAGL